jgi:hypothetical protein
MHNGLETGLELLFKEASASLTQSQFINEYSPLVCILNRGYALYRNEIEPLQRD